MTREITITVLIYIYYIRTTKVCSNPKWRLEVH